MNASYLSLTAYRQYNGLQKCNAYMCLVPSKAPFLELVIIRE